ncbi:MAG TPA: LptF/LptG family permease, partial [Verrucomicrobiae bacterium]
EIKSEIKVSKINNRNIREVRRAQLSVREILDYKSHHLDSGGRSSMLDTKLHGRLAAPWTCLVVVLLALPFGGVTGRRNVYVGVASSIVIVFAYFVLTQFMLALGAGGQLAGWIAAWLPLALFASAGITATAMVR